MQRPQAVDAWAPNLVGPISPARRLVAELDKSKPNALTPPTRTLASAPGLRRCTAVRCFAVDLVSARLTARQHPQWQGWRRPRRSCALRTSPTTPSPCCCLRTSQTASESRARAAPLPLCAAAAHAAPSLAHLPAPRELRDAVQGGSLAPECALANATLVPDLLVLHAAAYKALAAAKRGELRTRSLHAELVFSLSGSKHVSCLFGGGGMQRAACRAGAGLPSRPAGLPPLLLRTVPCHIAGQHLSPCLVVRR